MYIGQVAGTVVATVKHPFFNGHKLLLVERLDLTGEATAKYDIAVDSVQAGVGDRVLVLDEGTGARQVLNVEPWGPVRAVIVGVIDEIDLRARPGRQRELRRLVPGQCLGDHGAGAARDVCSRRPVDAQPKLRHRDRWQPLGPAGCRPLPRHPKRPQQGLHVRRADGSDRLGCQANRHGFLRNPTLRCSANLRPSSEILLHLEAYRQRPDVGAVVHAHPVNAITLSIAGVSLARCLIPEVIVNLGMIPTTEYAMPASAEGATVIRDLIQRYDALILQRHGSVTVGKDLWEAYLNLEKLENVAEITFKLLQIGREMPFPSGAVEKLIDKRDKHGLMLPGQRQEMETACGVCQLSGRCPLPARSS